MGSKVQQAKGVSGHLIDNFDGTYMFRVYSSDYSFNDYKVMHSDLVVTIDDEDTAFYTDEMGYKTLDHSPQTLGRGRNPQEPHPLAVVHNKLSEDEKTLIKLWRENAAAFEPKDEALGKTLKQMVAGSWLPPII